MQETVDDTRKELTNSIGNEVGRSLAEVVTALLKPGAMELGDLVGNSIGIVSDKIRRKRSANAAAAMREVKQTLNEANVDFAKLSPPTEEELHLLINGASLADDPTVRHLWSGLFAQSLNPNSNISAERPFIRVLESLTPLDARLIDFLAFTERTEKVLTQKISDRAPKGLDYKSAAGTEELAQFQAMRKAATDAAIADIENKALHHDLSGPMKTGWADNLLRQGVIQRPAIKLPNYRLRLESLDERNLVKSLQHLSDQLEAMKRVTAQNQSQPQQLLSKQAHSSQLQLQVCFTDFGRRLATACGLF